MKKYKVIKAAEENLDMDDSSEDFKAAQDMWNCISEIVSDLQGDLYDIIRGSLNEYGDNDVVWKAGETALQQMSICQDSLCDIMDDLQAYKPKINWD